MNDTLAYALEQDEKDKLKAFRDQFHFPTTADGKPAIYFCGNSLGLQPKGAQACVQRVLDAWKTYAVGGYMKGEAPWMTYAQRFKEPLGKLVGGRPDEIGVMNSLTVNLHLLLASFYRPTKTRYKILLEAGAFPSDQYVAQTQVLHHGFKPEDALIEVAPRANEQCIREEDIVAKIAQAGDTLALVLIGGVSYYTGQYFDLENITTKAHEAGALCGFDLAHAVGNVPMQLHDWNIDFAAWCCYKYLNGGPGAAGAIYVHERFSLDKSTPRLAGWSGSDLKTRFDMPHDFTPEPGADGWALSIAPGLILGGLEASLDLFAQAGLDNLRAKSIRLTGYLEYLLGRLPKDALEVITPRSENARGAQLSVFFPTGGQSLQTYLAEAGIITDYREPGVIRLTPTPLYNTFEDCFHVYQTLHKRLKSG